MQLHLNNSFDEFGTQFAWDATSLKAAQTCQRYYYYMMLEQYETKEKSVHLFFGGLYATALEHYHQHIAAGATHDEATCEVVHEALINSWVHNTKDGQRIAGTGHEAIFDSTTKTRESLIRTIIWYLEEFKDSDYKTYTLASGEAAVEHSFKLEIDHGFILTGHLDRLLTSAGQIWVQDQKTTGSQLSSHYFKQFDLDIQMSNYTFAGRAIFDIPIKGVMIDAASIQQGYTLFMRGMTYRSEAQLNEWYDEMLDLIVKTRANTLAFHDTGNVNNFPRNLTACGNYGGCSYRDVCSSPASLRSRVAEANLQRRSTQWDPMVER